jgi:hypothetical protein
MRHVLDEVPPVQARDGRADGLPDAESLHEAGADERQAGEHRPVSTALGQDPDVQLRQGMAASRGA